MALTRLPPAVQKDLAFVRDTTAYLKAKTSAIQAEPYRPLTDREIDELGMLATLELMVEKKRAELKKFGFTP